MNPIEPVGRRPEPVVRVKRVDDRRERERRRDPPPDEKQPPSGPDDEQTLDVRA